MQQNLSHAERKAIDSLKYNPDIIIKEADKGVAIVVDSSDYIQEAQTQLTNGDFYEQLSSELTQE